MPPSDHTEEPERLTWLAEIYRAYSADLQRYVCSKVGEPFLAEDLTSMVFLKALRWLKTDLCGRTGSLVKRLFPAEASIVNSTFSTLICNECVERFHTLLSQS